MIMGTRGANETKASCAQATKTEGEPPLINMHDQAGSERKRGAEQRGVVDIAGRGHWDWNPRHLRALNKTEPGWDPGLE